MTSTIRVKVNVIVYVADCINTGAATHNDGEQAAGMPG